LEPAALRWFGKKPRELDVEEAAFLAALTPAPLSTERRLRAAGQLDDRTLERVHAVLRAMRRSHVIDEVTYQAAKDARPRIRL
jgi:membrane peptidoglycan carboxypeptidase